MALVPGAEWLPVCASLPALSLSLSSTQAYTCTRTRVHVRRKRECSLQCNEQFAPNNSRRNITGIIALAKVAASFAPLNRVNFETIELKDQLDCDPAISPGILATRASSDQFLWELLWEQTIGEYRVFESIEPVLEEYFPFPRSFLFRI